MNSKIFTARSPTRVDVSGGTLDMWPLYNFVEGATTINIAIDIWTAAEMAVSVGPQISILSKDLDKVWEFTDFRTFLDSSDSSVKFYQCLFRPFSDYFLKNATGFKVSTSSQSPIGGGLGGSSSLVISALKAIYAFLGVPLPEVKQLVFEAHNIEAGMLRTPTGTQDYFPAASGGLNFIKYGVGGIEQEVFSIEGTPFEDHFLLVYTGKSHHSGLNNFEVLKSSVAGNSDVLGALGKIKVISEKMKAAILEEKWQALPELFKEEFSERLKLTPAFTSPEIEKLAEICLAAGALAVKICGAGGGGCVLVWVPPDKRKHVEAVCRKENFQCLNAKPVNPLK